MSPSTRSVARLLLFAVALAAAGFACGGKTTGGPGGGGSSSGSGSGGSNGSGSGGLPGNPGGPGVPDGPCEPGAACTAGSACGTAGGGSSSGPTCDLSCECANGTYECTGTPCTGPGDDTGDDEVDASLACPPSPSPGDSCAEDEMQCTYAGGGGCGGPTCYCNTGTWSCFEPPCPQADSGIVRDAGIDAFATDSAVLGDTGTPPDGQ